MKLPRQVTEAAKGFHRSGALLFFLASAAVNVLNFVFHVVVSRALGPSDYSALGALLALLTVISVPLSAIQLASAQAETRQGAGVGLGRSVRSITVLALGLLAVCMAGAPIINSALHLSGFTLPSLLGAWIALATIAAVPQGVLISDLRFREVGVATFVGTGLARVLLGGASAQLDGGVRGALLATVLAQATTVLLLIAQVRRRLHLHGEQLLPSATDGILSVGSLTGLAALTAIDTVAARNTLPAAEAGIYVAAATAGRITLFIPGAVALIVFPRFAAAAERGDASEGLLWRSAGIVLALGSLAAAVLAVVPGVAVRVLFGDKYHEATSTLPILAVAGAALGVVNLLSYFQIAHRSWAALIGWVGTALIGIGVFLRPGIDGHSLALMVLGITGACLLFSVSAVLVITPARTDQAVHLPIVDLESGAVVPAQVLTDGEMA
jgi:O-antigen/teichoic acid export membrane protein